MEYVYSKGYYIHFYSKVVSVWFSDFFRQKIWSHEGLINQWKARHFIISMFEVSPTGIAME